MDAKELFMNGEFVPVERGVISVRAHGFAYGTGCFEGIRGYWNESQEQLYLLKMREHYQRMENSWNVLRMRPKESIDDLCRITLELVRMHGYRSDVYVRPITYKSSRTIKLTLSTLDDAVAIYAFAMGNYVDINAGLSVWRVWMMLQ